MGNGQREQDLELILTIDEADVDLSASACDFIDECLKRLNSGRCLLASSRRRAERIRELIRRVQGED